MDDNIDEWLQKLKERAEKRQEKLFPLQEKDHTDSITTCSEAEVSYPALPLSPLPEESETLSMAETENKDESSTTEYKRENTSPSQLDYSSDLSLDCETDTTTTNDFYRAEPVVCHSSPDHRNKLDTVSRQASPRKTPHAPAGYHQHQQQPATDDPIPTQRSDPPIVKFLLQERQMEPVSRTRSLTGDQLIQDLAKKIERADMSIKQLSKAVTCTKIGSEGHIEAARLLKIAQVSLHDFRLQKHKLDNGIRETADSRGSLKLSQLGFETRSALKEDLAVDDVHHFFFCIASCGLEFKATQTIDTKHIRKQSQKDFINFEDVLVFTDLPPDFVVELQVFEFVKKSMKFVERTLEVLSTPKKSRPTIDTEFQRIGFVKLTKDDRKEEEFKNLKFENGSKYINKRFRFKMELQPEQLPRKAGMLHLRRLDSNGRPDWLRFWVDLSDGKIRFWKSKQDAKEKNSRPEQMIELIDLCSETVQKLTPDDELYRQHSFVLYERNQRIGGESDTLFQRILDDGKHKIIKHQFAAADKEDRDSWCTLLDKSMHSFREWNGRKNVHGVDEFKELFSR